MLKKRALRDPSIYECEIDERDLLYMSFDANVKRSKEEIEQLYRQAAQETQEDLDNIKGLALLHDIDIRELGLDDDVIKSADKTEWSGESLTDLMGKYFDKLSDIEKEIILTSMDEGFTEEQMMELFMANIDDMENLRRAYRLSA